MKYKINIAVSAKEDIFEAVDYIEYVLKNPTAADHLLNEVDKKINNLNIHPNKHPLVGDPILAAWGIHMILIENYIAFFIIRDDVVTVIRFLYQKRDWQNILQNDLI